MRIGINGRFLVAKRTGVQRAAYNLIKSLFQIDRVNEYILFTGDDEKENADWKKDNVTIVSSKLRHNESFRNHLWEQFYLPRLAYQHKIDILHSPANIAPIFYSGKSIVHIHDLCFVVNPQWYSFSFRTLYNLLIPRLAQRATRVVTNSNNSKNDLLQYFNLPSEKVDLVYWAVDDQFLTMSNQKIIPMFDRKEQYILYVGSLEPRKNIKVLIEAYEHLRRTRTDIKPKLILIGGESPLFAQVRLKLTDYREDVIFKGFVDDNQLREYYRAASVVAYPSLYEGFGLPPLEAMASGAPVVTSKISSIPEVVGNAALMVNPYNPVELSHALTQVLTDSSLRQRMVEQGLEQAKQFNWWKVARNIISIYHEVLNLEKKSEIKTISFDNWKTLYDLEPRKVIS